MKERGDLRRKLFSFGTNRFRSAGEAPEYLAEAFMKNYERPGIPELEKRKQKIAGELASAAEDKSSAEAMKAEYEAKLRDVNKEAESILETARRKAKAREEEMLDEAKAEAARIIERANREVELEKKKALDDMKQEIVDIAAFMAEKVVGNSIDVKIQDALIDETLKEMGEHTWQS